MKNILLPLILTIITSCELDNFPEPDATFAGKIVDIKTGETVQTRQPDGIKIRLIQKGYDSPVPYDFWAKSDGTFRNTRLFGGTYDVTVMDGPFHASVTKQVVLKDEGEVNEIFQVEPYVRITNANIAVSGNTITGSYKLSMGDGTTQIKYSRLICHVSPILHEYTNNLKSSPLNNLLAKTGAEIKAMSFSDQITGLRPGYYYARIAVESTNVLGKNNYSEIVKVEIK